jgi:hypothetical protein
VQLSAGFFGFLKLLGPDSQSEEIFQTVSLSGSGMLPKIFNLMWLPLFGRPTHQKYLTKN